MCFDEFQRNLGIARSILTARVERLTSLGILERFTLEDRANTESHRLTQKGEELYPVLVSLMQWGDRWIEEGKPPTTLVEHATGRPIGAVSVRAKEENQLSFRGIRFTSGPSATATNRDLIKRRNDLLLPAAGPNDAAK